tara:strand:- start:17 stop:190 length:174 start_codon:yes stop_codon:yes gene_type:complete
MKEWFFEGLARSHQGVLAVSEKFDVTVNNPAKWSAHTDVCANPCWEEEELIFKQVPF